MRMACSHRKHSAFRSCRQLDLQLCLLRHRPTFRSLSTRPPPLRWHNSVVSNNHCQHGAGVDLGRCQLHLAWERRRFVISKQVRCSVDSILAIHKAHFLLLTGNLLVTMSIAVRVRLCQVFQRPPCLRHQMENLQVSLRRQCSKAHQLKISLLRIQRFHRYVRLQLERKPRCLHDRLRMHLPCGHQRIY